MAPTKSAYRGCLLGLAAGDAMGYPIDKQTWREIRADYGPQGLMGYDLTGGNPAVSSHTQLCAFSCNGLLLGQTRERLNARTAPYARYIALSQKEWASTQRRYSTLRRTYCWVYWVEELRRRRCADSRMIDTLALEHLGSPAEPVNRLDGAGSLTAAVAAGLFAPAGERERLGAEAVALTFGSPTACLSGALVAHLTAAVMAQTETPTEALVEKALTAVASHPRVYEPLRLALDLAKRGGSRQRDMEALVCDNAAQVLAGAVYALLTCGDDFDTAMVTAVNHSGRSSAVAALTGALLGARLGMEGIPDFYLEGLEGADALRELADDLYAGCPQPVDLEWDRKYLQGER